MAQPTKEQRLDAIHKQAVKEFDLIQNAVRDERLQCLQDRRFYSVAGAQWEGQLAEQYENKPKFEVNKVHLAVIRIINEYRNNRITVNFQSDGSVKDDDLADTCNGMYRADENESTAEEAYDNAFEEAVGGGIGGWRLRNEYVDESDKDSDEQKICIEPIYDADSSIFFDLQAKRQDKSDAKHCFVLTSMSRDAYEEEYDDTPSTWPKTIMASNFDWSTPDVVYVAEYYKVEMKKKVVHIYEMLDGSERRILDEELDDDEMEMLAAIGAKEKDTKTIKVRKVHKYILSGGGVLEDCGYIAGPNIPIVVTYGKRWYVDNVERCMGHVRLSKDSQRLKNMQLSKLGELSAYGSVQKPLLTPEQVAGHENMWSQDNIKNWPYLLINPITDADGNVQLAGAIDYTRAPEIPPAMAALLQLTETDMQDLLGNQNQGEQLQGNISTETAYLVQNNLDMQTFIYMSNFAKAMKRSGEIWLGMAKEVYVEESRQKKTLSVDGEVGSVTLQQPGLNEKAETITKNDLTKAKMDITVEVGPSTATKRQATFRSLVKMAEITEDPETKQVLGGMAMMNMEGEGVGDVRRYFRKKLIRMGVVEPNDKEAEELKQERENEQPSAQDKYFEAAAKQADADAIKKQAESIETQANVDLLRAKTEEILANISIEKLNNFVEVVQALGPRLTPSGTVQQASPAPVSAVPGEPNPSGLQ